MASFEAAPNNGMHPTRNSAALILYGSSGRVMPGVGLLLFAKFDEIESVYCYENFVACIWHLDVIRHKFRSSSDR